MLTQVEVFGFPSGSLTLPVGDENAPFLVQGVDGIGPVDAAILTTPYSGSDGGALTGSSVGTRNIVFTFLLNPDWSANQTYEDLRDTLYGIFMPKSKINLRWTSTHMVPVEIIGYVEKCTPNIFTSDPQYQVSIICPDPAFVAVTETTIGSLVTPSGGMAITYDGTIETGFVMHINPSGALPAYENWFTVLVSPTQSNDFTFTGKVNSNQYIELDTRPGSKRVRTVPTSGTSQNLLSTVPANSPWPKLERGSNFLSVHAAALGLTYTITYNSKFGGI